MEEVATLKPPTQSGGSILSFDRHSIIGRSQAILQTFQLLEKVLDNSSTVLILGESGTGKELVARAIHANSFRKDHPFIVVNCSAIPEELLESELFGHEKGSFTGAIRTRVGKFEQAHQGTVFLDEIGDMSPSLQVKLLRLLQEQEFERVGGNKTTKVDVRVIAATHRDLEKAIQKERFREDLFYRLNVIPITMPPLRDRISDLPELADYFIKKFNRIRKRKIQGVSPSAMNHLKSYSWPGNIRELEHLVERLVVLKGEGLIEEEDLPPKFYNGKIKDEQLDRDLLLVGGGEEKIPSRQEDRNGDFLNPTLPAEGLDLKKAVDEFERALILQALSRSDGVKNRAAQLLGMNRTTLVEKLKKKGMDGRAG
jgi:transcriptional regulator with GAF, ATPase, and Fis domain